MLFLFATLLGFYFNAQAYTTATAPDSGRIYQVDLVLFQNNSYSYLPPDMPYSLFNDQLFSEAQVLRPDIDKAITPKAASEQAAELDTPLETSGPQIEKAIQALNKSEKYTVLYQLSWLSSFQYGKAKTFRLTKAPYYLWPSGTEESASQKTDSIDFPAEPTAQRGKDIDQIAEFDPLSQKHAALDGVISFTLGHYFDIHLQLQMLLPDRKNETFIELDSFDKKIFTPLKVYQIDQNIRSRSKKMIYIDSPNYGVLLYLTPIAKTEQKEL